MPKEPEDDATILRRYGIEPDPVIEAYKKDVDRTLLRENLRRTPDERSKRMIALQALAAEFVSAGKQIPPSGELNALLDRRRQPV